MALATHERQDIAAGGEEFRRIQLANGAVVTASVAAEELPNGYQKWGYLRFKTEGRTTRCYLGKVTAETIEESLRIGWELARQKRVLERIGAVWLVDVKEVEGGKK